MEPDGSRAPHRTPGGEVGTLPNAHQESFIPDQEEELDQTWKQMAVELLTEHQEER